MARPRRPKRLWARRSQLHEAPDRRPYGNHDLRRHARRLVRRVCSRAQPADRLRLARFTFHARGSRWCTYSRYADDLTFSTNKKVFPPEIAKPSDTDPHLWIPGSAEFVKNFETPAGIFY